jgi:hypothetical protein
MAADRLMYHGVLLLRLALGTMFIAHSVVYMLLTLTLAGTVKFFASIGLPAWIAYATILAEALGGLFLILGIQTRWVALALSPILIGDLGPFRKRLAICISRWWVGVSSLSFRALHRAGHARRWPICHFPILVSRRPGDRQVKRSRPQRDFTNAISMRSILTANAGRMIWLVLAVRRT